VAGEVYNVSGGHIYEIRDIVNMISQIVGKEVPVATDPALLRSTDEAVICGDSARLKELTGWQQSYSLETTITDMIAYWRSVL